MIDGWSESEREKAARVRSYTVRADPPTRLACTTSETRASGSTRPAMPVSDQCKGASLAAPHHHPLPLFFRLLLLLACVCSYCTESGNTRSVLCVRSSGGGGDKGQTISRTFGRHECDFVHRLLMQARELQQQEPDPRTIHAPTPAYTGTQTKSAHRRKRSYILISPFACFLIIVH